MCLIYSLTSFLTFSCFLLYSPSYGFERQCVPLQYGLEEGQHIQAVSCFPSMEIIVNTILISKLQNFVYPEIVCVSDSRCISYDEYMYYPIKNFTMPEQLCYAPLFFQEELLHSRSFLLKGYIRLLSFFHSCRLFMIVFYYYTCNRNTAEWCHSCFTFTAV